MTGARQAPVATHRAGPASVMWETRRVSCAETAKSRRRPKRSSAIKAATISEHEAGNLRRAGKASAIEPGREDRQRQRLHAEIFAGADIVERLEQGKRHADRDGGPRQRQVMRRASRHGRAPSMRAGFGKQRTLRLEHRARGEIDVRIEHETENEDRAGKRADVREPVVGRRAPAEHCAQRRLQRAERVENIDVDVGHDIGRDRERQRQQPRRACCGRETRTS